MGSPQRVAGANPVHSAISAQARKLAYPSPGMPAGEVVPASYAALARSHVALDALPKVSFYNRTMALLGRRPCASLSPEQRAHISADVLNCYPGIVQGLQVALGREVQGLYGLADRWAAAPQHDRPSWKAVLAENRTQAQNFQSLRQRMFAGVQDAYAHFDRASVERYHLQRTEDIGSAALASAERLLAFEGGSPERYYLRRLWHGGFNKSLLSYLGFHYRHPFIAPWSTQVVAMPMTDAAVQCLEHGAVVDGAKVATLTLMTVPSMLIIRGGHRVLNRFMNRVYHAANPETKGRPASYMPPVMPVVRRYVQGVAERMRNSMMQCFPVLQSIMEQRARGERVSRPTFDGVMPEGLPGTQLPPLRLVAHEQPLSFSGMLHEIFAPRAHVLAGILANLVTVSPIYSFAFFLPSLALGQTVFADAPLDLSSAIDDLPRMVSYTAYLLPLSYATMCARLAYRVPGSAIGSMKWQGMETADVPALDNLLS